MSVVFLYYPYVLRQGHSQSLDLTNSVRPASPGSSYLCLPSVGDYRCLPPHPCFMFPDLILFRTLKQKILFPSEMDCLLIP